jgi:hypothetical protein
VFLHDHQINYFSYYYSKKYSGNKLNQD